MFNKYILCRLLPLALLVLPVNSFADPLSVLEAGDGSFVLHGSDLSNVAVVDAVISYDASRLANPRLIQGSLAAGAMTAANVTVPGTVKVSLIGNGIQGSGPLVTLVFDRIGNTPGSITAVTGTITDSRGEKIQVALNTSDPSTTTAQTVPGEATPANPEPPQANPPTPEATPASTEGAAAQPAVVAMAEPGGARVLGGTVALPAELGAEAERGETEKLEELVDQPEKRDEQGGRVESPNPAKPEKKENVDSVRPTQQPTAEPVQLAEVIKPAPQQSVLERFRQYKGERTVKALSALFNQGDHPSFRQEPSVAVADGKRGVKVLIRNATGATAPNFAFDGARPGSLILEGDTWVIEAIPEKGALQARITMLQQGKMEELPLTLTPPADIDLDKSGKVTEEDFRLYLNGTGTAGVAKYDLNGDGRRDYMDDYIFTANYLAYHSGGGGHETAPREGVVRVGSTK